MMWLFPPKQPILKTENIHIWQADLNITPNLKSKLWETLSIDEKERANRFRFEKDKIHYIAGRGILRNLLGQYLQVSPIHIEFDYTTYGKPFLKKYNSLQFNVSHSGGIALFSFMHHHPIGVDIELLTREIEIPLLTTRFFAKKEAQQLLSLPKNQQNQGFFNCWTRKEAIIKAIGQGLSFPLDQFEVTLLPNVSAQLLTTYWNQKEAKEWTLISFVPQPNYVGALAVRAKFKKINYWNWKI